MSDNHFITIDGFESLTPQQAFDLSAKHLMEQKEQCAETEDDDCIYLRQDGNRCAAGVFLDEEKAKARGVDLTTIAGGWTYMRDTGYVQNTNFDLIDSLQDIHDMAWGDRKEGLRMLATEFGLRAPVTAQVYGSYYTCAEGDKLRRVLACRRADNCDHEQFWTDHWNSSMYGGIGLVGISLEEVVDDYLESGLLFEEGAPKDPTDEEISQALQKIIDDPDPEPDL